MYCNLISFFGLFVALLPAAPPERPTAPKPGQQQQQLPGAAFNMPHDAVPGMPASLAMGMSPHLPSSEAPKLKDFLPFMKPGSFGSKAAVAPTVSNDYAPGSAGSLPASVAASPVHLPQASVSFPPSPQRQPPVSNGPGSAGSGFVHADGGYPVPEALLSPTAPPGAPRSASPAHQLPVTVAHPGGPAESQQHPLPSRPMDVAYNIPPSNSQSSVARSFMPTMSANMGSYVTGTSATHPSSSQGYMQVMDQPPAVNIPAYSGPNFSQPGIGGSDGHAQRALPSNTSSFQSRLPSNTAPTAVHMPLSTANAHAQLSGMPYGSVNNIGAALVVSTNLNQSYPAGHIATGSVQLPDAGTAMPGVPVHQVNNSNNVQFPVVVGSNIEVSKPQYYHTPASVQPPTCAPGQPSYQSDNAPVVMPPTSTAGQAPYQSMQARPPSYEAVTQQYPPPLTQPVNPTQPRFTGGLPTSPYVPPGLSNVPVQPSYHAVRPDVPYGGVHAGHQQPVTSMLPQHSIPTQPHQPPPLAHPAMPGASQRAPLAASQHPVMSQPRYPSVGQTVPPGVPVPSQQHPSAVGHASSQTPPHAQFPANVQMPATRPQPRYPLAPNTSQAPYPGAVQQFEQPAYHGAGQQVANQMHIQPAVTLTNQQQQQQYPVRPEVAHAPGYPRQPSYAAASQAYQASSQLMQQPPSVDSHQVHYQSFVPHRQPLYHHPAASQQQAVVNLSPVVSSSFAAAQTAYSHQQLSDASASYAGSHVVGSAAGQMQALVDIPVCLPSPLQPSRVAAAEVSKNVDSLSDLDLSGKTTSTTGDAQPKQKDSGGKVEDGESAEGKDVAVDSSRKDQRDESDEETRRSLRQLRSSRDVYADPDTLMRFVAEVEKFQKHVDSLVKPTLGGYFPLDKEWKVSQLFIFLVAEYFLLLLSLLATDGLYCFHHNSQGHMVLGCLSVCIMLRLPADST